MVKIIKMKKSKYKRRRAIKCDLVERSKNNPGYCKYMITIAELDGTVHKQPAYGKDMQGALSRLINKERSVKIENKVTKNPGWVFLLWLALMGWPAFIMTETQQSTYLFYAFGGVVLLMGLLAWWNHYINKK